MDAVILVGGKGSRLAGIIDVPKPLAPIGNRVFLDHVIGLIEASGIAGKIILAAGYKAQHFHAWLRQSGLKAELIEEDAPLGTGGGALFALDRATSSEHVLIMNGDSFVPVDLAAMAMAHEKSGCLLTIAVTEVADVGRYGEVRITEDRVTAMLEKSGKRGRGLINAGIYMARPPALASLPRGPSSWEHDVIPALIPAGIRAFRTAGPFIDIGTPESYAVAEDFFAPDKFISASTA